MDKALVPTAQRLRIGRSNFRLLSDIKSKESTLQLVYDVLRICPFFKAFLVIEFWATTTVHHHAIRFKMDNKKHIMNLESFRDMLHICLRVYGQAFAEPPFEEEILAFICFLGHSAAIRTLTDVNINKLYQPWRSFAAIINKFLTGKSSGYDSLRLSQAQILWGLYHKRNIDYAYLMWEDFVYQVEHKNHKKSNEMYYPRFMKDDHMFSTIKLVSRHYNTQQFGALLPIELTNEEIRNSNAYKEYYAIAIGAAPPKPKASGKQTAKASKAKSLSTLSEVAMTEAQQLKLGTKRSMQQTYISQASGFGAYEGTGSIPGVLDAPTDESEEELSWNSTYDEGADYERKDGDDDEEDEGDDGEEGDGDDDDDQEVERDDDKDDKEEGGDDDQEYDDEYTKDTRDEESFDPILQTPENSNDEGNGEEDLELNVSGEEGHIKEEEEGELYRDVNINQGRGLQTTLDVEDSHVTLTPFNPDGMESIFETTSQMDVQTPTSVAPLPMTAQTMTPSTIATITTTSQAPILPTTVSSNIIQNLPNFSSLFRFDDRLSSLEANFSEAMQTNQFVGASDRLRDEAQRENDEFLKTINENMQKIIKEQVKEQVKTSYAVAVDLSEMKLKKILIEKMEGNKPDRGSKRRREGIEPELASALTKTATRSAGRSTHGSQSRQASATNYAFVEEPVQTTCQMEEPSHLEFDTGAEDQLFVQSSQHPECELAKQTDPRSSFNELMDTPLDFSNFLINRLKVDTLTPKLLAGPTYELMKGSCKILVELEYHLEEVFKATTDQLDWVNPEGQQYPHNLLKPLPLIPNNRGHRVIPFEHFINNDLEYLRGGASSRKYTTSITKTKAADYGYIKWIEYLVPRTMWIEEPIGYDKHALWRVSHWGRKRQQFYGFAVNRESARDVYYKRRIIAVTELKIVEWHNYKHLDWITVRRDDDKLYKFKEGDFKRLRIQDIENMLLLLVQGKLTNLTVEECFAFNVCL
nr:hypothetical protein [Tanacetum cinerariifolium]